MNSQKKTLLVINVDNVVDIITNSSSELFVLNGETKEIVSEMIRDIYPDYLTEYEEVVSLKEASNSQVDTYYDWVIGSWYDRYDYNLTKEQRKEQEIAHYTNQAKKYGLTVSKFYENWSKYKRGEAWCANISDKGYDAIRNYHDPNGNIFLVFSIEENPNFEMQEELERIATRYHLG